MNEKKFSWQALLIVTVLMIMGGFILYITGVPQISNLVDFKQYIFKHGFEFIVALFFIVVGIYGWIYFIINIKPHKCVLYLCDIEGDFLHFVDKKGVKFILNIGFLEGDINYEINQYYDALKQYEKIIKILGVSVSSPEVKKSYWLNLYTPYGNFEDMLVLPILYVILLPGLLSFILAKGTDKIYGLLCCIVPAYGIIYDLIKKIKK